MADQPAAAPSPYEEALKSPLLSRRIWGPVLVVVVVISGGILFRQAQQSRDRAAMDEAWNLVVGSTEYDTRTGIRSGDPVELGELGARLSDSPVGAWARLMQVTSALEDWDHAAAREALARLRAEHPDHFLVAGAYDFGDGREPRTIADNLDGFIQRQEAWRAQNSQLFGNPEPAADAPRVRLTTELGDFTVALYPEHAPRTVENFLSLCSEGFYDGTTFYEAQSGVRVEGGDPNTRNAEDPGSWGQGGGGRGVSDEENPLNLFRGVLATSASSSSTEESSSRFLITTGDAHHLGAQSTVFGVVIEGQEVLDQVQDRELEVGTLRLREPVVLVKAEVL